MTQTSAFAAVIVAAGTGQRFGGEIPKQYLTLEGRTVLEQASTALRQVDGVDFLVLVVSAEELEGERVAALKQRLAPDAIVAGGASRAESVLCGLAAVPDRFEFVLVHDAARPWVDAPLVLRVMEATCRVGAALPTLRVADTVKSVNAKGIVRETLDREALRLAQTPQGARREILVDALRAALVAGRQPTDEAAALEQAGHDVAVVEGSAQNKKITTVADLSAKSLRAPAAEESSVDWRVGTGFDIHAVDATRPLILGGVRFEGEPGLVGHSDADVVLHAAMDALLGAAGEGDIGVWFPPEDDQWAGADSCELGRRVAEVVRERGFELGNLDIMLLAERPKIRPHVPQMRQRIADAFGVDVDRVALKATTMEKLGALGRHEGIACQAVALLRKER
jgi:2-C-methyl-D-erythritol 4-phosphate cytidylyltransferase/2-C-methyl-D-erythritol 2,4-cyclodiphosphate synthase